MTLLVVVASLAFSGLTTIRVAVGVLPQLADPIDPPARRLLLAAEAPATLVAGAVAVATAAPFVSLSIGR